MKKSARIILLLTIITLLVAINDGVIYSGDSSTAQTVKNTAVKELPVSKLDIRYLGRTFYHDKDQAVYFDFTASGAEFNFDGTKLDVQFITDNINVKNKDKQAWIAVFVNEEKTPSKRFALDSSQKYYNIYQSNISKSVKIRIYKLSEAKTGKSGLVAMRMNAKAKIAKTPEKKRKIEFIGDSITCGYGIEGVNENPFRTSEENGSITYAAKTADYFNADYNIVAVSGIGIYSSFTATNRRNSKLLMSSIYPYTDKLLQMHKKEFPYQLWEKKKFISDLIVINLGVNDASYVKDSKWKRNSFGKNYYKFLHSIRLANPKAKIICTIRDKQDFLYEEIKEQVTNYKLRYKDDNITSMMLPSTLESEGFGSNWHPNLKTHERMAEAFITKVEKYMGWENYGNNKSNGR